MIVIGLVGGCTQEKLNLRARMRVWASMLCVMSVMKATTRFFFQSGRLSERNFCAICMWPLHIAKIAGHV